MKPLHRPDNPHFLWDRDTLCWNELYQPVEFDVAVGDRVRIPDWYLEHCSAEDREIAKGRAGTVVHVDAYSVVLAYEPIRESAHVEILTLMAKVDFEREM